MAVVQTPMKEMMEKVADKELPKPNLTELQRNIEVSEGWVKALENGTFKGSDVNVISNLMGWIKHQHDINVREFEAAKTAEIKAPEWGAPKKEEATA